LFLLAGGTALLALATTVLNRSTSLVRWPLALLGLYAIWIGVDAVG
jgi:hypothetical protein